MLKPVYESTDQLFTWAMWVRSLPSISATAQDSSAGGWDSELSQLNTDALRPKKSGPEISMLSGPTKEQ